MGRRGLFLPAACIAALAVLASAAPSLAQVAPPAGGAAEPSPVLPPATLAAIGAAAEAECRARLDARCLAETALARIAAGQRGGRAIAPNKASASVIAALANGGHSAALRAVLLTAEAVRRIPPQGLSESGAWDNLTLIRAGMTAQARLAAERIEEPARRADALLSLARVTLDPVTVASSLVAAEAYPDGQERGARLAWARALALAVSGDRDGLAAWLDALAGGPDFTADANGDPALGNIVIVAGVSDSIRTPNGAYIGGRNLPMLAAHAWAALGDGPRALAAAGEVRWPPARMWALDAVARYRPALRQAADARIVALPATHPDARSFRSGLQRAMVRLQMLPDVERMLVESKEDGDRYADLDKTASLQCLLAAAYARAGDGEAAERVAAWTGDAKRRTARMSAGGREPTPEALQDADRLVARVRLAAALARPAGHGRARELLDENAAPDAVEACVAAGRAECHALSFLLQAVSDIP